MGYVTAGENKTRLWLVVPGSGASDQSRGACDPLAESGPWARALAKCDNLDGEPLRCW